MEKNSTFFLSIEKRNIETNSLSKLKTEDSITEDYTVISKYASHFYADLYKNDVCKSSFSIFNSLKDVKKASDSFKEECDATLSIEENLKLNKLPGNDGLISEFYHTFSAEISKCNN